MEEGNRSEKKRKEEKENGNWIKEDDDRIIKGAGMEPVKLERQYLNKKEWNKEQDKRGDVVSQGVNWKEESEGDDGAEWKGERVIYLTTLKKKNCLYILFMEGLDAVNRLACCNDL